MYPTKQPAAIQSNQLPLFTKVNNTTQLMAARNEIISAATKKRLRCFKIAMSADSALTREV